MICFNKLTAFGLAISICTLALVTTAMGQDESAAKTEDQTMIFTKPTIDLGCIVSDVDAAVKFYTTAIGFKEVSGFSVDAQFATDVGLSDQKKLDVKVLKLGEGSGATQLKLLAATGESQKPKNDFIHSSLGFSYLSIYVKDMGAAMQRLETAGVKPVAQPKPIPGTPVALVLVRDPDGNLIELIGPMTAAAEASRHLNRACSSIGIFT